jgi:hypothetical protein
MRAATVEISSKSVRESSFPLSTKNAWAKYVRNRWPTNTLCAVQAEWGLTEGEARGVLYAQASQPTIDKILDREEAKRPLGAFKLGLVILQIRTQTDLSEFIIRQAEEAAHERLRWEQEERRLAELQARLSGCGSVAGGQDQPPRTMGSGDASLGSGAHAGRLEPRSFDPPKGGRR